MSLPPIPLRGLPRLLFIALLAAVACVTFALTGAIAGLIHIHSLTNL